MWLRGHRVEKANRSVPTSPQREGGNRGEAAGAPPLTRGSQRYDAPVTILQPLSSRPPAKSRYPPRLASASAEVRVPLVARRAMAGTLGSVFAAGRAHSACGVCVWLQRGERVGAEPGMERRGSERAGRAELGGREGAASGGGGGGGGTQPHVGSLNAGHLDATRVPHRLPPPYALQYCVSSAAGGWAEVACHGRCGSSPTRALGGARCGLATMTCGLAPAGRGGDAGGEERGGASGAQVCLLRRAPAQLRRHLPWLYLGACLRRSAKALPKRRYLTVFTFTAVIRMACPHRGRRRRRRSWIARRRCWKRSCGCCRRSGCA
jgi:hypothetical protein